MKSGSPERFELGTAGFGGAQPTIEEALAIHNRRIGDTAASLGISRKNLWQKMKKLQINAADDDAETG